MLQPPSPVPPSFMRPAMPIDIENLRQSANPLQGACSGVYLLFEDGELVYVGQTWNCLLRVAEQTGKGAKFTFTSWNFVPVNDPSERKAIEAEIKKRYRPKYN
jgi:excinuclease UvrABC nuclease subunit